MEINTTRFGRIEVEDDQIVTMPEGVIGFEGNKKYAILDHSPESPFKWFQSVEEPGLAFAITDPLQFFQDYKVDLKKTDLEFLGAKEESDLLVLAFVSVKRETATVTANLLGPIVINLKNLVAKQLILSDSNYSSSQDLMASQSIAATN